jgi:hypothetical protein
MLTLSSSVIQNQSSDANAHYFFHLASRQMLTLSSSVIQNQSSSDTNAQFFCHSEPIVVRY